MLSLMLLGSCNANAVDAYAGIGIGESYVDQGVFGEMDTAYKLFGGAQFNKNFAVEAAYMDLGQPVENFFGWTQEYDVWAVALWAKGILPVSERIDLFGKLGYAHWEYDKTDSRTSTTTSQSSNDFAWGLGISFDVGKKFAIPIEYEKIGTDLDNTAMFSVSGIYRF
jgi:OOP family OmpA-OmpF porin